MHKYFMFSYFIFPSNFSSFCVLVHYTIVKKHEKNWIARKIPDFPYRYHSWTMEVDLWYYDFRLIEGRLGQGLHIHMSIEYSRSYFFFYKHPCIHNESNFYSRDYIVPYKFPFWNCFFVKVNLIFLLLLLLLLSLFFFLFGICFWNR